MTLIQLINTDNMNQCKSVKSVSSVFHKQSNFQTIHIQTPWLNELREYFLVHALIGSGYTTYDLLFYVVGGVIGYGGLKRINKFYMNNKKPEM